MKRVAALVRMVLAGALACALSACWMSDKPLIGVHDAANVPFAGTYHGEGEDTPETMIIARSADGGYELSNGKEDKVPAAFVPLGGDWYLMQGEGRSDEEGTPPFYLYQVIQLSGGDLRFYSPMCDEVPGKFKGMKREKGEIESCNFTRLDGVKAMASAWIAKLGKGEIADEPEVLRRAAAN